MHDSLTSVEICEDFLSSGLMSLVTLVCADTGDVDRRKYYLVVMHETRQTALGIAVLLIATY